MENGHTEGHATGFGGTPESVSGGGSLVVIMIARLVVPPVGPEFAEACVYLAHTLWHALGSEVIAVRDGPDTWPCNDIEHGAPTSVHMMLMMTIAVTHSMKCHLSTDVEAGNCHVIIKFKMTHNILDERLL